ncbi:MAG: extracellular solute-binding protein [Clostridiales bacterium]|jgi:raffinose/stachyose/melibiose transport system substrate-binding protein|nr:extracellular solute-binding protein [Clostridiales bacterium]
MKRTKRPFLLKLSSLTLCAALLLTGCGGGGASAGSGSGNQTASGAGGKKTLTFWHIWGSGDSNSTAVAKVIADYETLHPDVKIEVQTFENDAYKTTIRTNVSGDTAPDIYSAWGGGFSKPFVDAGKVLKLDDYLTNEDRDKLVSGALKNFTYDGGVYGLTFGMSCSGLFCNSELFEKYGVPLPKTWEELISAIDTFKASGVIPISTSIKERWVIGMLFEAIALKEAGADQMYATLTKNGGSFSDPAYLDAAKKLMQLEEMGAFNSDAAAISRDEAEVPVKQGQAAMYYMGSWASGSVDAEDSVDAGKFKFIPFPTISGAKGLPTEFNGGGADGILVNAATADPALAADFVKYFTENLSREDYQAGNYLPTYKDAQVDESKISPTTLDIVDATKDASDFVLWWDTLLEGSDVTTYQDALDLMIQKQLTPEQFVEELKKIQP